MTVHDGPRQWVSQQLSGVSPSMHLSYVFSFRNEESNIPEIVRRVANATATIDDCTYEMIFVNDASTDGSYELLMSLQSRYPIAIVTTSRPFGVTPCVLAGMAEASGDAVVYMDCDLQDPPELVPEMVKRFREGVEVVHTTRLSRDGEPRRKLIATAIAYRLLNAASEMPLPVDTGDFKLYSRRAVKSLLSIKDSEPYIRGMAVWIGYRQDFIPYHREARHSGRSRVGWRKAIQEFLRGMTGYSSAPLYLSFGMAAAALVLSFALIAWAVLTKILGVAAPGSASTIGAIALMGGAILIAIGVLGLYLSRILSEVMDRPRHVISRIDPVDHSPMKISEPPPDGQV